MGPHTRSRSHARSHHGASVLCALALAWASTSAAQSSSADKTAALRHHAAGVEAFSAGHYKTAIDAFRQADQLQPSPAIAYNIARAYEKLGDSAHALASYRDYLRRADPAPDRPRVERHIAELERRLAAREVRQLNAAGTAPSVASAPVMVVEARPETDTEAKAEAATGSEAETAAGSEAETATGSEDGAAAESEAATDAELDRSATARTASAAPEPRSMRSEKRAALHFKPQLAAASRRPARDERSSTLTAPLGIAALGSATATLAAAGIFELLRRDAQHDARVAPTQIEFDQQRERMDDRQTVARVLAGVSGGLAITGVALLVAHAGEESAPAGGAARNNGLQAALALSPSAAKVRVWTSF